MTKTRPEVSQDDIEEVRKAFLAELDSKPKDCIHPKDLEKILKDDDWLRRFILHQEGNKENARNMMWTAVNWRKEQNVNDINESNIKIDLICLGGFFIHGADIDNCKMLVFKCKKHTKNSVDMDLLKRCIIYWFEKMERVSNGEQCTIFFDMEGCGLSNMDMEVIKYLIGLFKEYYPYFLNYILIFEMPWVLTAAFKIVKTWLPEKAVEKIKFIYKKDISNYVPPEHILKSWGGQNSYEFRFVPETSVEAEEKEKIPTGNNKKVHFVSSMPEQTAGSIGDKETDGGYLKVSPSSIITFVRDANELISTLELQNSDDTLHVSYKLKTTSPEKFRVKPSTGCLAPGETANVSVTLLPGFQLGGLSRDKFLVMSTPMESGELDNLDLTELWKNTSGRKVFQHRLKCIQSGEVTKDGNSAVSAPISLSDNDQTNFNLLSSSISQLKNAQSELRSSVKLTQYFQMATLMVVLIVGVVLGYMSRNLKEMSTENSYCRELNDP